MAAQPYILEPEPDALGQRNLGGNRVQAEPVGQHATRLKI
jgi:hypothetical protein